LNDFILELTFENWDYWEKWLEIFLNKEIPKIPHPVEYARSRKTLTVEEIFCDKNIGRNIIELTEKYYQNEIVINNYLKNNKPMYKAKGKFYGDIDGIEETKVMWENIIKI
jgi:hypothetical protein